MTRTRQKSMNNVRIGAPEWIVTFGDMMSLLLCFFILLQMFSELNRDQEYQRVITGVKEAFGYSGGVGTLPIAEPPVRSIVEQIEQLALKQLETPHMSKSPDESVQGPNLRVTRVREGVVFSIGGPSTFDPESARIREPAREEIRRLATLLAGRSNRIIVRGHAANKYLSPDSPWADLYELSYARARNVVDLLAEFGIDESHLRIEAIGAWEPVRSRAVGVEATAENRRVEIIMTETLVEEMNQDASFTDAEAAQGGT